MLNEIVSLNVLFASVFIGAMAYVYAEILTAPQRPLNWLYVLADTKLPWFIAKPLITCFTCVSGQWGIYWYLLHDYSDITITDFIAAPCIAMITSNLIHKVLSNEAA
jgi:uncharacterized membrane protein YjjB (DUF3815 family)